MSRSADKAYTEAITRFVDASLAIGTPSFGDALLRAANGIARVDHCVVFTFHRLAPSGCLLTVGRGDVDLSIRLAGDYLAGPYVDDPNLRYLQPGAPPHVILDFSARDYPKDYWNHFIVQANIIDSVACIATKGDRAVYCNFLRLTGHGSYDDRERAELGRVLPMLASFAALHYTLFGPFLLREQLTRLRTPDDEVRLLAERLGHSALDDLTERERQVCFRILLGYSSEAIGLHLGVATSTVITHRKRAYEKLGIISQNELFSLYLHSLPGFAP